jgi:cell division protein FtsI/penicillin-binding protein 2
MTEDDTTGEQPPADRGIGLTAASIGLDPNAYPRHSSVLKARRRVPWAAILGVVLVAILVAGAVVFVAGRKSPDRNRARAQAFLAAWSSGDTAAMQSMVDPTASPTTATSTSTSTSSSSSPTTGAAGVGVAADLQAVEAGLHVTRATYTLDSLTRTDGVTTAHFTAHDTLAGVGSWTYHSSFALVSGAGGPKVVWSRAVIEPAVGPHDILTSRMTWAPRAAILGNGGQVLAGQLDSVTIGVEPRRMTDEAALARALQQTLQINPASVAAALAAPGVRPDEFVQLAVVPKATYLTAKPIIYPIPGLEFKEGDTYSNLSSNFASALLGTVGPITAQQLKKLGPPYMAGDQVGQYGLQAAYESSLAGTPSSDIVVVDPTIADAAHRDVSILRHTAGQAPVPLQTTLDVAIQQAADQALAGVTLPSALVAIDAAGNIRAVVSGPSGAQFDRALDGQYPPGSTFKVLTTDALLTAGVAPTSSLTCPSTVTVDGKVFHNFESESAGALTLSRAFAVSCNTAFIGATVAHLSADQLRAAAAQFGFGVDLKLGLDTVGGRFPTGGDAVETAADAIGQGQVIASPMQMASVAAAVMSGQWHPPVLLPAHTSTATTGLPGPLAPAVQAQLTALMAGVVTGGTGTAAAVSGKVVVGKTGTAEFGHANPPQTHAWFIGFSGNLAVAVIVEGGGVGGTVAAPLVHKFFALAPTS